MKGAGEQGENTQEKKEYDNDYKKRGEYGDKKTHWKKDGGDFYEKSGEPKEEDDVKGLTLEEFKAQQEAKKRNLAKAQAREHDKTADKNKNLQQVERPNEKQQQINNQVKSMDTYNLGEAKKGEHTDLLAFRQGSDDERREYRPRYDDGGEPRFGGRGGSRGGFRGRDEGGRGGFRGDRGGYRGSRANEGAARSGGKDLLSQKDFPSLL